MTKKTTTRIFLAFISLILLLSLVKCSNDFIGVGTRDGAKLIPATWIKSDLMKGYYMPGRTNTITQYINGVPFIGDSSYAIEQIDTVRIIQKLIKTKTE